MKFPRLFTAVSAALLLGAACFTANAQYVPVSLTVPTVEADTISNNVAQVIDCTDQSQVAISINTSATNIVLRFSAGVNNTHWQTNAWVVTLTSASAITTITNINVGGIGKLRLDSVAVVGTIPGTNSISYGVKKSHW